MNPIRFRNALLAAALLAAPVGAADLLEYADPDGTVKTVPVVRVTKDEEKVFSARILVGGRRRKLDLPSRRVIRFRRGDPGSENQWSKRLATGKRMVASGELATKGNVPGAEEVFLKIAYTTEKGVKGEEAAYAAQPWHNMYALFYLIETRYRMGLQGEKSKLDLALANVAEFKKRSTGKRSIEWDIPAAKGTSRRGKVYSWGSSRLMPQVLLLEARILAAMGQKDKTVAAFDAVIERGKKGVDSPYVLTAAFMAKAEVEAEGQPSETQESIYRKAGSILGSLARNQPDAFGQQVLSHASNRALLKGADLLRESAVRNKVTWDSPLARYRQLKAAEGRNDAALAIGAQAGIGVCLTEKGQGEEAYQALLDVVVGGHEYPEQMALALFYLGKAAKLFADEVDAQGGKGDFLRAESERWWSDLKERYPTSSWAEKAG